MQFTFAQNNLSVFDLGESLALYRQALFLTESRHRCPEGAFIIDFPADDESPRLQELNT